MACVIRASSCSMFYWYFELVHGRRLLSTIAHANNGIGAGAQRRRTGTTRICDERYFIVIV